MAETAALQRQQQAASVDDVSSARTIAKKKPKNFVICILFLRELLLFSLISRRIQNLITTFNDRIGKPMNNYPHSLKKNQKQKKKKYTLFISG